MDGNFLVTGEFEVMLSKGLGQHFAYDEKERLFQDAKNIADLLAMVMDRRTQEMKEGKQHNPPSIEYTPEKNSLSVDTTVEQAKTASAKIK
jgi:hypothetical protein